MLTKLISILKNVPGRHEQKTHGDRFSSPGVMSGKGGHPDWKPISGTITPGADESSSAFEKVDSFMWDADSCCMSQVHSPSNKVINDVANRAKVSKDVAKDFIETWNSSDFDKDPVGFATMHRAIAKETGIPMSKYQIDTFKNVKSDPKKLKDYEKISRAIYDTTQEELSKRGMTELPLYRGVLTEKGGIKTGTSVKHDMSSAESWTMDRDAADEFGKIFSDDDKHSGGIMSATIPASRVFSTSITGIGTTAEGEFVILGGKNNDVRMDPGVVIQSVTEAESKAAFLKKIGGNA